MDATRLEDVALATEVVTLEHLKTKTGEPVKVLCEPINEFTLVRILGMPGSPAMSEAERSAAMEAHFKSFDNNPEKMQELIFPVLEAGAALMTNDGPYRPAFSDKTLGSIPFRFLKVADAMALFTAILRVSGYAGGAAEAARFPDGRTDGGTGQ